MATLDTNPYEKLNIIFAPVASATDVINYSGQSATHNSPGNNAATGNVPTSIIINPA